MDQIRWRRSSYSSGNGGECVEIAHTRDAIRDAKNPGTALVAITVDTLLLAVKSGRLGR
ncbi:DUF397 domain-containing protein [Actinokineospora enzanensis]|uniref:DUF397 domain-containing protein n=1 Tax=Actinokineospora enzanensis TaxID=155975 RepID=UPI0003812BE4|nr:DUF397 domain-containing protein [Actinokineospora enzanensis]